MPKKEGRGRFPKFVVHRRLDQDMLDFDPGNPVSYPTFVLRIDGEDPAAIEALRAYAMATSDTELAVDLAAIVDQCATPAGTTAYFRHEARKSVGGGE